MEFVEQIVNGCDCHDSHPYRIVKQKVSDKYNAYKAVEPRTPGGPIAQYTSVQKIVLRVETQVNPETGKEEKVNVMGAKEYSSLEDAKSDCKKDSKKSGD